MKEVLKNKLMNSKPLEELEVIMTFRKESNKKLKISREITKICMPRELQELMKKRIITIGKKNLMILITSGRGMTTKKNLSKNKNCRPGNLIINS